VSRDVRTSVPAGALVLTLAVLSAACGTASNYLDPQGPRYAGEYAGPPPATGDVRVVTFNIAHAERIPQAIAILRKYDSLRAPDVLALQEMDESGTEAIARELGLNYVYYPASRGPGDERDMGEALLTPWPIEESWKVKLPHVTRGIHRSRAAVAARIRIGGHALVAYSVHFASPWGMGPGGRKDQAQTVLEDALARGLVPLGEPAAGVVREAKQASDHRPVWARLAFAP
jgi:endonuclease/exonuclease/phosphatase family metal-dependent hydrolase